MAEIEHTDDEWRALLSDEEFDVLRRAGTERPWSGEYVSTHTDGTYHCRACGGALFDSGTKYDSHCGWPSFFEALPEAVRFVEDASHGMQRTEVRCQRCDSHLGHIFPDGPEPTGVRYCMNSVSLRLDER